MEDAGKTKQLTLGKKIRKKRIEKKMTQQDLVGDFITRNMLSQIENGIATPSIKTLKYIAEKLEVPLSYLMVGEHDEEFNKNYEFDDIETIGTKARKIYFEGDRQKFIEIAENNPQMLENNKENSMIYAIACLDSAVEAFESGDVVQCAEYCKKTEKGLANLGELPAKKQLKKQAELYKFLCLPVLTESGEEHRPEKPGELNSENFMDKTFDENGMCRQGIIAAYRALKQDHPEEALVLLRKAEEIAENFLGHPYKKNIYKLFEMIFLKLEDYKNAYLYTSKILELYAKQNQKQ